MPIRHGGILLKNSSIWWRLSCFLSTAFPRSSTPWTWKTFFAKSMPTVVIFMVDAPAPLKWLASAPTLAHTMPLGVGASIPLEMDSAAARRLDAAAAV